MTYGLLGMSAVIFEPFEYAQVLYACSGKFNNKPFHLTVPGPLVSHSCNTSSWQLAPQDVPTQATVASASGRLGLGQIFIFVAMEPVFKSVEEPQVDCKS